MIRLTATLFRARVATAAAAPPSPSVPLAGVLMALLLAAGSLGVRAEDASSAGPAPVPPGTTQPSGPAPATGTPAGTPAQPATAEATAGEDVAASQAAARADAEFFAQNAHRPGVVPLHGGGQALRLSEGSGAAAAGAQMVVVNLSRRGLREPPLAAESAPGGEAAVPPGVQNARYRTQNLPRPLFEAVQLMHVGDRWEIYTPALAKVNGSGKAHPGRPALAASVFTLELLSAK